MENKYYFYCNHMGGWYKSIELIDEEDLYCEVCGTEDYLLNEEPMTIEEFAKEYSEEYAEGEKEGIFE